ncbi:ABC-type transport system substrate-binding protein [Inhella inkyongensis]|uniref:ABC-type transport system substrate-binding protein n=1 Tax=Inhella inkyongensis TaxID=392593 RepID=A0A840RXS0_9BURK|nr:ABC transporter substrate-binding protein [Inhella inkyongensis]MBB5202725.1 ABC-type transport system substrate-binding protein [Inhella inkyongensis]
MRRRDLLASAALPLPAWASAAPERVLRVGTDIAEVGFDPPRVSDRTSVTINAHIFESPLTYDYLARPALLRPQTAAALPEASENFTRWVFTLQPGIFFADDPAFGGKPRELVAADYVYSIKRFFDPRIPTEHLFHFENAGILGLSELRQRALKAKTGLDYDAPVAGLRALDRYRFEIRLARPAPRFVQLFAVPGLTGALAREVVEHYDDELPAHPVGTGPFMLQRWRRGSQVRLVRNPRFREQHFDSLATDLNAEDQALLKRLQGRRLPLVDAVEVNVILEEQPRWLAFHGGEIDVLELPPTLAPAVMPGGRLAPYLAQRGVQARAQVDASVRHTFFNCEDPDIGGLQPERVALRRAIALAYDNTEELRSVFKGQGVPAQSMLVPAVYGFDATLRSAAGSGDMARARALLDTYGYRDVDRDGWREHPDGRSLTLRLAGLSDSRQRAINELWLKKMRLLGLRIVFEPGQFGELIKNSLAGTLQMWSYSWTTSQPDGDFFLALGYGPNAGQANDARLVLPAFDRAYEKQRALPDGPERLAAMRAANRLMLAYQPYLPHFHALRVDLSQPGVEGYRRHPFTRDWWRYTAKE